MPDQFDDILNEAEDLTLKELNSKISSLTRLKDAEINSLFPKKPDKEKLIQLMQIVQGAVSENTKRKQLIDNIEALAGTVIKVVGKLA